VNGGYLQRTSRGGSVNLMPPNSDAHNSQTSTHSPKQHEGPTEAHKRLSVCFSLPSCLPPPNNSYCPLTLLETRNNTPHHPNIPSAEIKHFDREMPTAKPSLAYKVTRFLWRTERIVISIMCPPSQPDVSPPKLGCVSSSNYNPRIY
jgi:hypothetical protein